MTIELNVCFKMICERESEGSILNCHGVFHKAVAVSGTDFTVPADGFGDLGGQTIEGINDFVHLACKSGEASLAGEVPGARGVQSSCGYEDRM